MELLDFDSCCNFTSKNPESLDGLILLYKKSSEIEIISPEVLKESLRGEIIEFLNLTKAEDSNCARIFHAKGGSFPFIALSALKKETNSCSEIENTRKAGALAAKALKNLKIRNFVVPADKFAKELAIGISLSLYSYSVLKKNSAKKSETKDESKRKKSLDEKKENSSKKKEIYSVRSLEKFDDFDLGMSIGYYHNLARFLGDTPANLLTPTLFCEYAKKFTENLENVKVEVFDRDYMEKNNMNLLLSVSNGSVEQPKLLVMSYKGKSDQETDLAFVGKGVTFDSGGISIKPSGKMAEMKADMLGGAAVLCALALCARTKVPINLQITVPLTENLPSGSATKPGDVKFGMSGKSVEIDNTDAEGRLILADALTHVQKNDSPKYIVDVATLTGAMTVALGNVYSGLFCEDDDFSQLITQCGIDTDDLVWRMPLSDRYRNATDSSVADIRNVGTPGTGGSSTAAVFLKEFVEDKSAKWAHLDIASTMTNSYNKDLYGNGMSGKPLMLLYELCKKISTK